MTRWSKNQNTKAILMRRSSRSRRASTRRRASRRSSAKTCARSGCRNPRSSAWSRASGSPSSRRRNPTMRERSCWRIRIPSPCSRRLMRTHSRLCRIGRRRAGRPSSMRKWSRSTANACASPSRDRKGSSSCRPRFRSRRSRAATACASAASSPSPTRRRSSGCPTKNRSCS